MIRGTKRTKHHTEGKKKQSAQYQIHKLYKCMYSAVIIGQYHSHYPRRSELMTARKTLPSIPLRLYCHCFLVPRPDVSLILVPLPPIPIPEIVIRTTPKAQNAIKFFLKR